MTLTRRELLFAGLSSLVSGCLYRQPYQRPYQFYRTEQLGISDDPEYKPYTIMSQKDGERRLTEMVRDYSLTKEEAWLYFPFQGGDNGVWVDVGEEQTEMGLVMNPDIIPSIFNSLSRKEKIQGEITHYHLHPVGGILQNISRQFPSMTAFMISDSEIAYYSLPSDKDFSSHALLEKLALAYHFFLRPSVAVTLTGNYHYHIDSSILQLKPREFDKWLQKYNDAIIYNIGLETPAMMHQFSEIGAHIRFERTGYLRTPIKITRQ